MAPATVMAPMFCPAIRLIVEPTTCPLELVAFTTLPLPPVRTLTDALPALTPFSVIFPAYVPVAGWNVPPPRTPLLMVIVPDAWGWAPYMVTIPEADEEVLTGSTVIPPLPMSRRLPACDALSVELTVPR